MKKSDPAICVKTRQFLRIFFCPKIGLEMERRKYMKDEKNKFLGEEKISKLLFRFSIPCILSLLISSLYNIVDQIFIGNSELGYLGNAA